MNIDISTKIEQTYENVEAIGAGGSGTIYKAYHKRLQKYVVLKKIHSNIKNSINIRMETDILKNLHHYYLPQVLDFLEIDNDVYTVMDFIPGKSFEKLIEEGHKFTPVQVLKYTRQLCEAMAYLHEQNPPIMHGDIKPANIMLTPDDNICLIDFNISGFLSEGNMVTVGYTPGYAAPEQRMAVINLKNRIINGNSIKEVHIADNDETEILVEDNLRESVTVDNTVISIDLRADIFSIGATVYHLATGLRYDLNTAEDRLIEEVMTGYSNGFCIILVKALEINPDNRFKNAGDMLRAVNNIHKYDKKYKKMVMKQEICFIAIILLISISVTTYIAGNQKMKQEKFETYDAMIDELEEARSNGDESFEILFEETCSFMPEKLDAYYQKALYLVEKGQYEEGITFITNNLINETVFLGQVFADDVYYLLANCYFELEDYENAVIYYQAAINIDNQVSEYYGDYAIALVYCDRINNAEEVLRQGREKGMDSDYVLLVSAEIEAAQGKYEEALQYFEECLNITENQRMKLRAYVLADKTLKKQETSEEILLKSVELLKKAEVELELSNQILILERLAQDYIDLSTLTGNLEYDQEAIDVFNKIIQYGWDNYTTYINMSILYEKSGQLDKAKEVLNKLLDADESNYITYKRLAILEIDIQETKLNENRNYSQFLEYYNKTIELYKELVTETNDLEIQWLEQAYSQLVDSGWLEE